MDKVGKKEIAGHKPVMVLGQAVSYVDQYDAALLYPIARRTDFSEAVSAVEIIDNPPPMLGVDIWNAYELSWLDSYGKPQIAIATFWVPAHSSHIVESKSLKLYLMSFSQTRFAAVQAVEQTLERDIGRICGAPICVKLALSDSPLEESPHAATVISLDHLQVETTIYSPTPGLLKVGPDRVETEEHLSSSLLKSNCPMTGQPDWADIFIYYHGPQIDHVSLLKYLISFRDHADFHENCIERIYKDILLLCRPKKLSVYARYTRRGGIDINPFRSNFDTTWPENVRTPRQ